MIRSEPKSGAQCKVQLCALIKKLLLKKCSMKEVMCLEMCRHCGGSLSSQPADIVPTLVLTELVPLLLPPVDRRPPRLCLPCFPLHCNAFHPPLSPP